MRRSLAGGLAALAFVSACGGDGGEPSESRRLVFTTDAGHGRFGAFSIRADGTGLRRLTGDIGVVEPRWIDGGRRIAYSASGVVAQTAGIWTMDADGENKQSLAAVQAAFKAPAGDAQPSWSPDGRLLAATRTVGRRPFQAVEVGGLDSRMRYRLAGKRGSDARNPEFSPDGELIAFEMRRPRGASRFDDGIYIVGLKGDDPRRVTPMAWSASGPSWIPGQDRVAFHRLNGLRTDVWSVRLNGQGLRKEPVGINPDWSDDGRRVAFVDERDGNRELFVADADGGNRKQLTHDLLDQVHVDWEPEVRR